MKRVVVTGLGSVSPCGTTNEEILSAINNHKQCFVKSKWDVVEFYGEVSEDYKYSLNKKKIRYTDKVSQLALYASESAILDSRLKLSNLNKERCGISIGTSMGGFQTLHTELTESALHGLEKISLLGMPKLLHNMISANLSIALNFKGGVYTYNNACASSATAIGEAFQKIQRDEFDVMLVGGSECCISEQVFKSFHRLRALSRSTNIDKASIPFSKDRNGFILSEGAALLVLEEYEHAIARNAPIYCEIKGYATTSDASSLVAPDIDGITRCMKKALDNAKIIASEVTYINAHGTGTKANDLIEAKAINKIFKSPFVSSTKSIHGHLLGASGALEALLCCLMIRNKQLFAQSNVSYSDVDPEINLNLLLGDSINYEGGNILSNSFAFGGSNVSLVFSNEY
ncbi:MAG TPA: beta-ketoacyl-[acyl-carrier-protein] synthase family protein [Enterococcus sp.]|nr:beta-ketoacyl-[acyl-carrier-protein] synthase family protein [Enterococcus sp.]